jgi:hypothetical protein
MKKRNKRYEYGAFFKYQELFKKLIDLMSILPKERLGFNGIYFQRNNNLNIIKITNSTISYFRNSLNSIKCDSNNNILDESYKKNIISSNSKESKNTKRENLFMTTLPKLTSLKRKKFNLFSPNNTESNFFKEYKSRNYNNKHKERNNSSSPIYKTINQNNLDFLKNNKKYYQYYFINYKTLKRDNSNRSNRKIFIHHLKDKNHFSNLSKHLQNVLHKKTFSFDNEKSNNLNSFKSLENKIVFPSRKIKLVKKNPIRILQKVTFSNEISTNNNNN